MITIFQSQVDQIFEHARASLPDECCGLLGGRDNLVGSIYKLKNAALNSSVEYEAAPKDLFAAQKKMRERNEELIGIYHSHPRQKEPIPSPTDISRAFYPNAVYFIVGFDDEMPVLRAFRIYKNERRWERAEFVVIN